MNANRKSNAIRGAITDDTKALKANFTVTNRGTTIYLDNTGSNLVMDSGPFDVKFEVE